VIVIFIYLFIIVGLEDVLATSGSHAVKLTDGFDFQHGFPISVPQKNHSSKTPFLSWEHGTDGQSDAVVELSESFQGALWRAQAYNGGLGQSLN